MAAPRSLLERLPLKPGTAASVLAASLTLVTAEFVRSGLYGGYFTQVIDTKYGLPVAVGGMVFTAHLIADTVMRAPAGVAIQRYGPRRVVLGGAVLSLLALCFLLLPVAPSIWTVLLVAALHGIGFSPVWPAMMNLTADAALPGYEGRTLTVATSALMPLVGLGFVVYGVLARSPAFPLMLLTVGLLAACVLVSTLLPVRRLLPAPPVGEPGPRKRASVMQAVLPVLPLLPAALMQTLTQSVIGNWLFRIAPDLGLSHLQLIAMLALGGVIAFGSMPRTGKLADGGRARLAVTVGYLLVAVGMLGFALTPPTWALFLLVPFIGLGYAFVMPGWAALVAQTLPEAQRPAAWGLLMTVENGGMAAGPTLGGLMYASAGAPGPFALNAGLCLFTAFGYLVFRRYFPSTASRAPGADAAPPVPLHVVPTPATLDADQARLRDPAHPPPSP